MALLAPIFPQALSGMIPIESIQAIGGLFVIIPNNITIGAGDYIYLYLNNILIAFEIVANPPNLPLQIFVPIQFVPLNNFNAFYRVDDRANTPQDSASVNIQITSSAPIPVEQLQLIISTLASNYEPQTIAVQPLNRGVVTGQIGTSINVTISTPGIIRESGLNSISLRIGSNNQADFSVYSPVQGLHTISVRDESNPSNNVISSTEFGPYRMGSNVITSVNYSTGAPANGRTYNSIYLRTEDLTHAGEPITHVRAILRDSRAVIVGYPTQTADIALNADKSATINLLSAVVETTTVELSVVAQSDSAKVIQTVFVPPSPISGLSAANFDPIYHCYFLA